MFERMDERRFINSEEFKKYRKFAFRDDMMKLSVGMILANSFNKVVQGISDFLIMPLVSYAVSKTGDEWRNMNLEPARGLKLEIGRLAGVFMDFIMVSIILYLIYIKIGGLLFVKGEEARIPEKECPNCFSKIHAQAKRCPMCTGGVIVKKRGVGGKDKGTKSP